MKTINWVFVFFLLPFLINGQIPNGNFESWPDTLVESPYGEELISRGAVQPLMSIPGGWEAHEVSFGVCRVENSCEEDYALLLFSWYHGAVTFLKQGFALDSRPEAIRGCYKYSHIDTANYEVAEHFAKAELWKNGEVIGNAFFEFDTIPSYRDFEMPIIYSSEATPDSMTLLFKSDTYGTSNFPSDGFLYLDELHLVDPINTATTAIGEDAFSVYPNPFANSFFIDCRQEGDFYYELYNLKGELLQKDSLLQMSNSLTVAHLPEGVYILNIVGGEQERLVQKFIKN